MKNRKENAALGWIWQVAGGGKKWVALLLGLRVAQSAGAVGFALMMRSVVDSAVNANQNAFTRSLLYFLLLVAALLLCQAAARYVEERAKAVMEKNFRMRLFRQLLTRDFGAVTAVHTGEWMNRMTSDVQTVVNAAAQILPGLCGMLVRLAAALVLLLQMTPSLVLVLLPGGLIMAGFSAALRKRLKGYHKASQQADGRVRSYAQERLAGLLVVRTFTREEACMEQAGRLMDDRIDARMKRIGFMNLCQAALNSALELARVLGVGVCSWGIYQSTMTYGTMSAVLQLVNQLEMPFASFSSLLPQYYSMVASGERLMEAERFPADTGAQGMSGEEIKEYYVNQFAAVGLRDAVFSYGQEEPVLDHLSMEVRKGEFVAFTGQSGCGKSTALKMLLCLYRLSGGQGYLKNNDGTERELTAMERGLFAYVPQGNQLLSGTIRETVAFGDEARMARDGDIQKALAVACADGFVSELPLGLDTVLGERGSGLSEGQLQRLAIARAVLSGRPVLLLDEATSALDSATEEQVLRNLRTMTDRTVLIVTHRNAALAVCDRRIHFG